MKLMNGSEVQLLMSMLEWRKTSLRSVDLDRNDAAIDGC